MTLNKNSEAVCTTSVIFVKGLKTVLNLMKTMISVVFTSVQFFFITEHRNLHY